MHDTFFVVTRPLDLATSFLVVVIIFLGCWWIILKLSTPQPRRFLFVMAVTLVVGLILASLPTFMLVTGVIWPSLVVVLQLGTIGGALIGTVLFGTLAVLVWKLFAALINRL